MPRNLIVTCGTSQIDQRRIQEAGDKVINAKSGRERRSEQAKWKEVKDYAANLREPGEGISDDCIKQVIGPWHGRLTKEGEHCETLLGGLTARWASVDDDIGKDLNPFGAEMSTLRMMATATPPLFSSGEDSIVLLYSDTPGGAFCAGVLYRLLTHPEVYNMPPGNIDPRRIPELREQPRDVDKAEDKTRQALLEARNEQEGIQNVFVMTGGFKSTIPILTVYALLYEDPIYYLFERSKALRRVQPQGTVESLPQKRRWIFRLEDREAQKDRISVKLTVDISIDVLPGEPKSPTF